MVFVINTFSGNDKYRNNNNKTPTFALVLMGGQNKNSFIAVMMIGRKKGRKNKKFYSSNDD